MNRKREVFVFLVLFLVLFVSLSFVAAQDLGDISDQATKTAENVSETIEDIKVKFLGTEWKEFLLKNKFIKRADKALTKLNPLFFLLFSRNYSLSLEMFFVFLLWLFVLLSVGSYTSFFEHPGFEKYGLSGLTKLIAPLAITIILAHIQVFNSITAGIIKVIFYKSSTLWSIAAFVIVITGLIFILFLNKMLGDRLKKFKEDAEKKELKHEVEKQKAELEGMEEAAG